MIDAIHTITSTIKNKLDELRFLGNNDTKTFKRILQAIILMDLVEWCGDHSEYDDQRVQSRLKEIQNSIFLRNCGFDIKHIGKKEYASVNIPSSNDEWKLVTDAPFVKILNTEVSKTSSFKFKDIQNKTCIPKEIEFENYKTLDVKNDGEIKTVTVPDIDISNFDDCDRMNTYIKNIETKDSDGNTVIVKEIWYIDDNGNWHKGNGEESGIGEKQVNMLINNKIEKLRIKDFSENGNSLESGILTDGGENIGKIDLATTKDLTDLL